MKNFDEALEGLMVKYLGLYMHTWIVAKDHVMHEDELAAAGLIGKKDRDSDSDSDSTAEESDRDQAQQIKSKPGRRGFRFFDPEGTDLPRGRRLARERLKKKKSD